MNALPLRLRLTAFIPGPLLLIAVAVGVWQVRNARATAADLFDRTLLADSSGGQVFCHVYAPDDGRGIAEADRTRVLARFGQASPGTGSGLGLSIAETVARRTGGDLRTETDGPGLTVSLTLPCG